MAISLTKQTDGAVVTGLNNQNSGSFVLAGGLYGFTAIVAAPGNIGLQILGPDGATFVDVFTRLTANGYQTAQLPAGTYQFNGTSTNAAAAVTRIHYN